MNLYYITVTGKGGNKARTLQHTFELSSGDIQKDAETAHRNLRLSKDRELMSVHTVNVHSGERSKILDYGA